MIMPVIIGPTRGSMLSYGAIELSISTTNIVKADRLFSVRASTPEKRDKTPRMNPAKRKTVPYKFVEG
jgi:hypothetical protein